MASWRPAHPCTLRRAMSSRRYRVYFVADREAEVSDSFRYVDLAEQIAFRSVATHAVLLWIAPTYGAPNPPIGVGAHPVGYAGLGHFRKHFAVRHLSGPLCRRRRGYATGCGSIRESGVDDRELLLVRREGDAVWLHEVIHDNLNVTGFRVDPVDVVLFLLGIGFDALVIAADAVGGICGPDEPSEATTASFGEFSFLPVCLSAMMITEPSSSVRVTRRPLCSHVSRRPSRSMVLPFEFNDGWRYTLV